MFWAAAHALTHASAGNPNAFCSCNHFDATNPYRIPFVVASPKKEKTVLKQVKNTDVANLELNAKVVGSVALTTQASALTAHTETGLLLHNTLPSQPPHISACKRRSFEEKTAF